MATPSFNHTPATPRTPLQSQVEFALLDRLHLEEDSPYAWQSLDVHPQLDSELDLDDRELGWTDESVDAGAAQFFGTLDAMWDAADRARTVSPLDRLMEQFGQRVPADLLEKIVDRASEIAGNVERSGQAALTQLISCVDGSIPGWSADDWRTIARPYALAMRDSASPATISKEVAWDDLSTIERAKLSLEITLAALEELQMEDFESEDD